MKRGPNTHYRCARIYASDTPSTSQPGVVWRASILRGREHCSCPGFQHHGHCRHASALINSMCGWDSRTNPLGSRRPIAARFCPMCAHPIEEYEDD